MANLRRRTLLTTAAGAALAQGVPAESTHTNGAESTVPGRPSSRDPATWTRDEKVWVVARQAGAVGRQKVMWHTRGVIYGFKYPASPIPLVRFKGCDQQWWRPQDDGSFLRTKAFITFFTDYETDEMLDEFTNPITGKTVVPHPNSNRLRNGQRLSRNGWSHIDIERAFPDYYRDFSIDDMAIDVVGGTLSIHSKVNWPKPLASQPYNQDNTWFARLDDIMDPHLDWVPSHAAGQILMGSSSNLGMDDPADGQVLWHLERFKIRSYDELPRDYLERAAAEFDDFGIDPAEDTEASKLERKIQRAVRANPGTP